MKLREMLALVGGPTFLDDRVSRLSGVSDELISDELIVTFLNEAQRRLCDEAWVLEDLKTPEVCQIQLRENVTDYALHPSILGIKSVRLSDSDLDLSRVNYYDNRLHLTQGDEDGSFWDTSAVTTESAGRPSRWSSDMGTRALRVRLKPDSVAAPLKLKLAVVREPVCVLDVSNPEACPEVEPKYHLAMIKYAAGNCAVGGDVDIAMVAKGRGWIKDFEAELERAKRFKRRLQNAPPRYRFGGWARNGG